MDNRPIGIFDSGVGGLTVLKELAKVLPKEDIIYFGDTARVPYGTKSHDTIVRFSIENVLFLLRFNVKLIIIACNTSSSVALAALKRNFKVPIVGVIEPGADEAVGISRNGRIGIIGTSTTVRSLSYNKYILKKNRLAKIFSVSCPLFVPFVEEGWIDKRVTSDVIREYLAPLKRKSIDTLVLGCTHYPLLKERIKKFMGSRLSIVDSAVSTAKAK